MPDLTWEEVLADVERDLCRSAALVAATPSAAAPALTLAPSPLCLPPLTAMPPVPPELAARILELRDRAVELQDQLQVALGQVRSVSTLRARAVLSTAPVAVPQYLDSRV